MPRPLFHCEGLRHLSLADNELGAVPAALASLAQLTHLDLSKNVLTDLPETMKQCRQLEVIQVRYALQLWPGMETKLNCLKAMYFEQHDVMVYLLT